MTNSYTIHGGKPLKGEVVLSGAKNVALKTIIAALMFEGKVILENIPRINDVLDLIELVAAIGGKARISGDNRLEVEGEGLKENKIDLFYGSKIRVSFLFFAPLLMKFGECFVPNPGGCRLGERPINRIVDGMKSLGVKVDYDSKTGYYRAHLESPPKGRYRFSKPTHTGTELLIMIALMTEEEVVIENCATEPEIDDLIVFLNEAGAKVKKDGNKVTVKKSLRLSQKFPFKIISDRNEFVTYASLAIASKGDVTIGDIPKASVESFLEKMKEVGAGVEEKTPSKFRFFYRGDLKPATIITSPHPGFMTDWQPTFAILLTQAKGESIIHERLFENRFSYVEELKKLGAEIEFFEPEVDNPKEFYHFNWESGKEYKQAIKIHGGGRLHNGVLTINDLRAGAALACAALLAPGESIVNGVSQLERGYENFIKKIRALGGDIKTT